MNNAKMYQAPKLVEYGRIEELTKAFRRRGTGDILSNAIFGRDSGCWTKAAPLCKKSTGS